MTDINLGVYTARLDLGNSIYATSEKLAIRYHNFENVRFKDFIRGLLDAGLKRHDPPPYPTPPRPAPFEAKVDAPMTMERLFARLNTFIGDQTIVIADIGNALFGAADLYIHQDTEFLGPAYYASMGFAVPAALGVQLARPELRPLVFVGDGAFQMTGMELSVMVRQKLNPVIVVLNNEGYGTERQIHDGPFNEILGWNYYKLPEFLGAGRAFLVKTEGDLERALTDAATVSDTYCLLDVCLSPKDHSAAMTRLAERLSKRI